MVLLGGTGMLGPPSCPIYGVSCPAWLLPEPPRVSAPRVAEPVV